MMMVVFGCLWMISATTTTTQNNNNFCQKREAFPKKNWSFLFVPSSPLLLFLNHNRRHGVGL
jgi:hypothetical protein